MLNPFPHVKTGWKQLSKIVNTIIDGANSERPTIGSGLTFCETPNGVIVSLIREKKKKKPAIPQPVIPLKKWLTLPLRITLEGQASVYNQDAFIYAAPDNNFTNPILYPTYDPLGTLELGNGTWALGPVSGGGGGGGAPGDAATNPIYYYPFALPSGGYPITFLNNIFQPISTDGSISVSGGNLSNTTATTTHVLDEGINLTGWSWSAIDAFSAWLDQIRYNADYPHGFSYGIASGTVTEYNWELTMELSPLSPIPNNVEEGRYYFQSGEVPSGAVYGLVGDQPNVYGHRAGSLGQFTVNDSSELGTFGATI